MPPKANAAYSQNVPAKYSLHYYVAYVGMPTRVCAWMRACVRTCVRACVRRSRMCVRAYAPRSCVRVCAYWNGTAVVVRVAHWLSHHILLAPLSVREMILKLPN